MRNRLCVVGVLGALAAIGAATPAGAVTITEFEIEPGKGSETHAPRYIHPGPDGNLWYTNAGPKAGVYRISTTGERIAPILDSKQPVDLVTAPDGTVYWSSDGGVGRRLPNGSVDILGLGASYGIELLPGGLLRFFRQVGQAGASICEFQGEVWGAPTTCAGAGLAGRITDLTLDGAGRMWVVYHEANRISARTPTAFNLAIDLPLGSDPVRTALGPDGNMWVTMYGAGAIDRFTPAGNRTRFMLPAGSKPNDVAVGPDGALWITELGANKIGRMTLDGVLTNEFAIPSAGATPAGITAGPDGAIWFTESGTGKIGRLTLDPPGGGGPGGGSGDGGGGGVVVDALAPSFTTAPAFSPKRFRVAAGSTPKAAQRRRAAPKGSSLTYSLSEPAAVTIAIQRPTLGRRVAGACRKPKRSNRGKPRCTRWVTVGTLTRNGLQGANAVKFTGRIGRRALSAGGYRASVTANDAAGNRSSVKTASFAIAP